MVDGDLTIRTPEKRLKHVKYLLGYTLKELNRQQDMVTQQRILAYNQFVEAETKKNVRKMERMKYAVDQLKEMEKDLAEAVVIKSKKKPTLKDF